MSKSRLLSSVSESGNGGQDWEQAIKFETLNKGLNEKVLYKLFLDKWDGQTQVVPGLSGGATPPGSLAAEQQVMSREVAQNDPRSALLLHNSGQWSGRFIRLNDHGLEQGRFSTSLSVQENGGIIEACLTYCNSGQQRS